LSIRNYSPFSPDTKQDTEKNLSIPKGTSKIATHRAKEKRKALPKTFLFKKSMFIGIDVGGANTKIVTSDGVVNSVYAPLWKNKSILYDLLSEYASASELEAVGAVMTGELCDCFVTRREGVLHIKEALSAVFKEVKFFNSHCLFKDSTEVDKAPLSFASTNWLASSKLISEQYEDAIFVDLGSTTTDVIPIAGGMIKARRTDLKRLKSGELI